MNNELLFNPVERLIQYHTLLSGEDSRSLMELSELTEISISVIREDFCVIFNSPLNNFEFDEEYLSNTGVDSDTDFNTKDCLAGKYDDFHFISMSVNDEDDYRDYVSVPVTIDEYRAFQDLFEQQAFPKVAYSEKSFISSTIRQKKYVNDFDVNVLNNLDSIELAIKENYTIQFIYKNLSGKNEKVIIKPIKIGFDATENRYMIITTNDNHVEIYDVDYIIGAIKPSKESKIAKPELLALADKVWGFEYNECLNLDGSFKKPIQVSVKFKNHGNVFSKVERDLSFRTPTRLEINKNDELVYEDKIYGKNSFINWVLSFGSSAKITKPKSLADEVYSICKEAAERI